MKARTLITIALAATMLVACNKDESEMNNWKGEIRLSSGVTMQQTRANDSNVPDKQIANGQQVQVVVTKQSADTEAEAGYGYNQALTAQGDGTFAAPGTAMFYPKSGQGVSIYAYHPSTATASFSVIEDQGKADGTDYFQSDLLYSAKTDYAKQSGSHALSFDHKLSKLTYTLTAGTGSPSLTGATVVWMNVLKSAPFTAATGVVGTASGSAVTITPHTTYGAIIVPQTVNASTKLLKVTLAGGGELYYTPTTDQVFEGGKKYNYTITVNLSGLTVTSSITDWDSVGNNRTGTAEM